MGRPEGIVAIASLLALLGAAPAFGQGTIPDDNSAIDEYVEGLPGPSGERPARDAPPGREGRGDAQGPLDPATVAKLEASGPEGAAAAALAQGTGPTREELRKAGSRGGASADLADAADADRGSPLRAIGALTGSDEGGMGAALPIILGLVLLAAIAATLARKRSRDNPAG